MVSKGSFSSSLTLLESPQGHSLSHDTGVFARVVQDGSVGLREAQAQGRNGPRGPQLPLIPRHRQARDRAKFQRRLRIKPLGHPVKMEE